eukprot:GFYU01001690.1.p2 GENE.GFYU01001690.1~~GFYU01001690.1.p2  ORF type:complete len:277 (+),score=98.36 GFYU01001690.1:161-991(+)
MSTPVSKALNTLAKGAIGLGVAGSIAQASLFVVDGGHQAVVWDRFRGVLPDTYGEGMHVRLPWVQKPYIFEIRTRPRTIKSVTPTKDLQMVNISLRVLFKPKKKELPTIYKSLGVDYDERVLPSIGNEVLKSVVAHYNAEQLLTLRDKVSREVRVALIQRASEFNIVLDDVAITDLTFAREFAAAVEAKQVAQQMSERAKFVVIQSEQEKRANIVRAEGEAAAAQLINQAMQSSGPGLVELRKIEAAREIAETLARSRNITYLPNSGNVLMNLQTH